MITIFLKRGKYFFAIKQKKNGPLVGADRSYDLLVRVIEPALEEINATTDIMVSCEVVRSDVGGRGKKKITGFKFHITEKTHEEKQIIMGTWGIPFEDILLLEDGQRPDFKDLEPETDLPFKCD